MNEGLKYPRGAHGAAMADGRVEVLVLTRDHLETLFTAAVTAGLWGKQSTLGGMYEILRDANADDVAPGDVADLCERTWDDWLGAAYDMTYELAGGTVEAIDDAGAQRYD